jgi:glycosyltransferase involved in cell wall biosynthesis
VVHTHGYRADVLAGRAVGRRATRVATVHGFTGGDWKNRLYERLQIGSYRHYDAVIAVSRSVEVRLQGQGLGAPRLVLLPNAWSSPVPALSRQAAREALGIAPDATVVGWVGRLSAEKGCDVLLQAAALLPDSGIRFSVVGDGAERSRLEAQAVSLGLGDRVTWHGLMPAAGRLMAAFDLFALSSRTEGTPIALFEAMAAGVPVVATAVGGVPDVLGADQGWLVPSESPAELAASIRLALSDRAEALRRTVRASEHLGRDYAADPWLDRHVQLYSRLISGKRAPSP